MKLERNFTLGELISDVGTFGDAYKVYEGDEVFCGKTPKLRHIISDRYAVKMDEYLRRVTMSREHENFIAEKIYNLGLAPKPEGVHKISLKGLNDFKLPAFVNEYDEKLVDFHTASMVHGKTILNRKKDDAFKELIKAGFSFQIDSYHHPKNILYSSEKGIQIIDYGWFEFKGVKNPFPTIGIGSKELRDKQSQGVKNFTQGLKKILF